MHVLVIGAGAAGLMAARELARAGRRVTVLEARDRCGGRIYPLPAAEFGYPAEGGAEFIHGAAPLTQGLMREAGLALMPRDGTRWSLQAGAAMAADADPPDIDRFERALRAVDVDLPVFDFLEAHFGERRFDLLRRSVTRTVEGYDAADPRRFSTLALRAEWLSRDDDVHARVGGGYGALIGQLAADCRRCGAEIHFGAAVAAVLETGGRLAARCRDGALVAADAAVLAVPLPLLAEIALPPAAAARAQAAGDIGFGNVVKILLRFRRRWWAALANGRLAEAAFLRSPAPVPTWWTQHPAEHPVLTGWFAGPRADGVAGRGEAGLVALGMASLAAMSGLPQARLQGDLVAARAIDWSRDPFARGAYSYATPRTRAALAVLRRVAGDGIYFCGEALYEGPDMATVEAALASGRDTAAMLLAGAAAP